MQNWKIETMAITENVRAKKAADDAYELLEAEAGGFVGMGFDRFWTRLLDRVQELHGPAPPQQVGPPEVPMTDDESKEFGGSGIPFGKHHSERVDQVPLPYLVWLGDQPDFRLSLRRYLRSPRIAREIEEMTDDWME